MILKQSIWDIVHAPEPDFLVLTYSDGLGVDDLTVTYSDGTGIDDLVVSYGEE